MLLLLKKKILTSPISFYLKKDFYKNCIWHYSVEQWRKVKKDLRKCMIIMI